MACVTGDPGRWQNACLYCRHATHSLADVVLRRGAPPSPVGSPRSVPSRRGRPRRSPRRGRPRRLYAREASPSMFAYCTEVLHLSEAEAYLRIAAARAAREHPLLLTMLADGRLHLTAIAKLAPHLTLENREDLLEAGRPQVEARDEGARRGAFAPSGCSGGDAKAARPPGGDYLAGAPNRPGRQGAFSRECVRREVLRSMANSVRTELARGSPNCVQPESRRPAVQRFPPRGEPARLAPSPARLG